MSLRLDAELTIDSTEVERMIAAGDRIYELAAVSSLNKETTKARTQIKRRIASDSNLRVGLVGKHLRVVKARISKYRTRVFLPPTLSAGQLGKQQFGPPRQGRKRTGGGIKSGSKKYQRAFVARDSGGRDRVFRRAPKGGLAKSHDTKEAAPLLMVGRSAPGRSLRAMRVHLTNARKTVYEEMSRASDRLGETLTNELAWRLDRAR